MKVKMLFLPSRGHLGNISEARVLPCRISPPSVRTAVMFRSSLTFPASNIVTLRHCGIAPFCQLY